MKRYNHLFILAAIAIALFTGCSATGPLYSDVSKSGSFTPRPGNGMILVYWPPHFFTGSSGYFLFANNVLLPGQWHEGGFYSYEAAPGPLNLAFSNSQGKATATGEAVSILLGGANYLAYVGSHRRIGLDINILPEQTHYVQLAHIRGEFALKEVPKEEGERDIQECHWVNSPVK